MMKEPMKRIYPATIVALLVGLFPVVSLAQQVEYYHLDALGSVRAVTDESGDIVTRHDFLPYGEEWNEPPSADTRRFTGKERDSETNLDYFGARYYGPETARFASVDPVITWQENLADPQRWNRYAYARDNPLRYTDPDGKVLVPVLLGAWAVFEVASTAYDAYTAYQTVTDPNASKAAKAIAVGGLILGVATVGGGYGTAGKEALEHADDAVDLVKGTGAFADAAKGGGRVNKVQPVEGAGPHTGFKRDPQTGKVTGYTEFDGAGNPVKRFRGEGKPHGSVDPPLVLEPKPGKGPGSPLNRARPARPDEIPGGGQ